MEIRAKEKALTVKEWMKIQLILFVPGLNVIMFVKWLVSEKTNVNLKNYLIACLVIILIVINISYTLFVRLKDKFDFL
ncbi:MAG: hypothetical protein ACRC0S_10135 [Fusobacteriaceae bacterium]